LVHFAGDNQPSRRLWQPPDRAVGGLVGTVLFLCVLGAPWVRWEVVVGKEPSSLMAGGPFLCWKDPAVRLRIQLGPSVWPPCSSPCHPQLASLDTRSLPARAMCPPSGQAALAAVVPRGGLLYSDSGVISVIERLHCAGFSLSLSLSVSVSVSVSLSLFLKAHLQHP
jgi:hypothetical protein